MNVSESYSWLDQVLHKVAFKGIGVQKELADLEDRLFVERLENISTEKPVFITSLPRAGTTLLLEVLSAVSTFASHTYRDMPFVLCPILGEKITKIFRKEANLRARAHADGISIGYDSPEALEEVLWMAFWKEKYSSEKIELWSEDDRQAEFEQFFRSHMRKIIAVRSLTANGHESARRYISKNNANIARLTLLPVLFPDCRIVIPIRNPWDHIRSLRNQHKRFTAIHATDPFSLLYMDWLGHFEFGERLRPINFNNWLVRSKELDPSHEEFWFTYWVETYEAILSSENSNIYFFDYDRACADPEQRLGLLADVLELEHPTELLMQASRFRAPTAYQESSECLNTPLYKRVQEVYDTMTEKAS